MDARAGGRLADIRGRLGRTGPRWRASYPLLYWQAPSILNPYLSGGTKDLDAASLVLEPLARYDDSGVLAPWLAASVPTAANGGISDDRKTVTWTLREGLRWSDGSPVTAADAVFTAEYCRSAAGGCAQLAKFADVVDVRARGDIRRLTYDRENSLRGDHAG